MLPLVIHLPSDLFSRWTIRYRARRRSIPGRISFCFFDQVEKASHSIRDMVLALRYRLHICPCGPFWMVLFAVDAIPNTPPNATVSLESIGAVGWYSNRYIIDEGGLVSKSTLAENSVTPGTVNIVGILRALKPDYYVAWETWELDTLLDDPNSQIWLRDNYDELRRYSGCGKTWVLFRHRDMH